MPTSPFHCSYSETSDHEVTNSLIQDRLSQRSKMGNFQVSKIVLLAVLYSVWIVESLYKSGPKIAVCKDTSIKFVNCVNQKYPLSHLSLTFICGGIIRRRLYREVRKCMNGTTDTESRVKSYCRWITTKIVNGKRKGRLVSMLLCRHNQ